MENKNYAVNDDRINTLLDSGILSVDNRNKIDPVIGALAALFNTDVSDDLVERNKQFNEYRDTIVTLVPTLVDFKYSFQLSKSEYLDLKKIVLTGIEYNRENLFIGLVVRDTFFSHYDESKDPKKTSILFEKVNESEELYATFELDINEITRLSHLTGLFTIKDLTSKLADNFSEIVKKVGEITQIYNHYTIVIEKLSEAGGNWTLVISEKDEADDVENLEVEAEKIED